MTSGKQRTADKPLGKSVAAQHQIFTLLQLLALQVLIGLHSNSKIRFFFRSTNLADGT